MSRNNINKLNSYQVIHFLRNNRDSYLVKSEYGGGWCADDEENDKGNFSERVLDNIKILLEERTQEDIFSETLNRIIFKLKL